jgi:hypothetical protein
MPDELDDVTAALASTAVKDLLCDVDAEPVSATADRAGSGPTRPSASELDATAREHDLGRHGAGEFNPILPGAHGAFPTVRLRFRSRRIRSRV